jgi:hypothetical protein
LQNGKGTTAIPPAMAHPEAVAQKVDEPQLHLY